MASDVSNSFPPSATINSSRHRTHAFSFYFYSSLLMLTYPNPPNYTRFRHCAAPLMLSCSTWPYPALFRKPTASHHLRTSPPPTLHSPHRPLQRQMLVNGFNRVSRSVSRQAKAGKGGKICARLALQYDNLASRSPPLSWKDLPRP